MFVRIAPFCTTWFILRSNPAPSATCPLRRASPDLSLGPPLFFIGSVVKHVAVMRMDELHPWPVIFCCSSAILASMSFTLLAAWQPL